MVVNYQLGKIYKLESPSGLIYIGSTCEPTLAKRMANHRTSYRNYINGKPKSRTTSIKLFEEDYENTKIYLIEDYPCDSKDQLLKREGEIIKQYNCVNRGIAGQTKKECDRAYQKRNKERIRHQRKEYYAKNAEKIKATSKRYIENNKQKITTQHKAYYDRIKQTPEFRAKEKAKRQEKSEKHKLYMKEYYKKNKATLLEKGLIYSKEKVNCICGSIFSRGNTATHKKTKNHIRFENTLKFIKEHDPEFHNIIIKDHQSNFN